MTRRSRTAGRCRTPGAATHSTRSTRCRCRRAHLPAGEVLRFRDRRVSTRTSRNQPYLSYVRAVRCRHTGAHPRDDHAPSRAEIRRGVKVDRQTPHLCCRSRTLIGAAIITTLRRDGYDVLDCVGQVDTSRPGVTPGVSSRTTGRSASLSPLAAPPGSSGNQRYPAELIYRQPSDCHARDSLRRGPSAPGV